MKKLGFTLAEVLITLGIIGMVASMTIPTLITDFQRRQFETKFAKTYSMIMNGFRLYLVDEYCTSSICSPIQDYYLEAVVDEDYTHIDNMFESTFKVIKTCRGSEQKNECLPEKMYGIDGSNVDFDDVLSPYTVIFADGSSLSCLGSVYGALLLLMDTNGLAAPNTYGKDLFMFVMDVSTNRYEHLPLMFPWGDSNAGPAWWTPWHEDATLCGQKGQKVLPTDNSNGQGCGARLLEEGFKINYY